MDRPAATYNTQPKRVLLVALRPRCYSEAIGYAIQHARPHLGVQIISADDLSLYVSAYQPDLVLCSHPRENPKESPREARAGEALSSPSLSSSSPVWVEYHPYAQPSGIRVNGKKLDLKRTVELADLLKAVDDLVDHVRALPAV